MLLYFLNFNLPMNYLGGLVKNVSSDLEGLGLGLWFCISNKLPCDVINAGPQTILLLIVV